MSRRGFMFAMLGVLLGTATGRLAIGQQCTCSSCGEAVECVKVCKLKWIEKEVRFTCWKSEYQDICVPCRSERCGKEHISGCECQEGADGNGRKLIYGVWQPQGADLKTRRNLMKKTVVKKIPSFIWEVESRCQECCRNCFGTDQALPEGIPQPPECAALMDVSEATPVFRDAGRYEQIELERVGRKPKVSGEVTNPTIVRALEILGN